MKKVCKGMLLAALMAGIIMSTGPAFAAGRQGARNGQIVGKQQCLKVQGQQRIRLRDGSCLKANIAGAGSAQKRGNTYGPGDGTGNSGSGPKDGSGYGAPTQR